MPPRGRAATDPLCRQRATHRIAELELTHVHFAGHVSDEELVAYYDVADLFLCASEHEGFCVPLVEAFDRQIPVLAYAATAVPDTMDGAGVLFTDKDPTAVASLMDLANKIARTARAGAAAEVVEGAIDTLLKLLAPFAPHLAAEAYERVD